MEKILFVAAEGLPYIKSGGLADVIGSLPQAILKKGYDVRVVLPLYNKIIDKFFDELKLETSFRMKVASFDQPVRIFSHVSKGVTFYFVENQGYFERDGMYGYSDDGERYAFFQHAVYFMMNDLKYYPDIIHSHDWHSGMMAVLGRHKYGLQNKEIAKARHYFTIHNLLFQGNFPSSLIVDQFDLPYSLYENGSLRFHDGLSFMKAAIVYSDKINTVSNTYAHEILGEAFGEGMQDILRLREHDLWGIVNGIDIESQNPETDTTIAQNYTVKTLTQKEKNKLDLQKQLGLRVSKDVCLVGMVSRLSFQKGVQLILLKLKDIMGLDIQLVILGTGEQQYEYDLRQSENMYKRRMVYYGGYSDEISRKIYAGADIFLMPSLFEPCGISQLISMRYGTLPVVRETGGLKDTVIPYNQYDKTGTGFTFRHFNEEDFYYVLRQAVDLYYENPTDFKTLQKNAMAIDVSWDKSADLYIQMYNA